MSKVNETLESILANIEQQSGNIEANLSNAEQASLGVEDDAQAAIYLLVERYKDVQVIGNIIGAQLALVKLKAARDEVALLKATLAAAIHSDSFKGEIQQQMTAQVLKAAANS